MAERAHRTLQDIMRASLCSAGAPDDLWVEALYAEGYTCNRRPHAGINGEIPIQRRLCREVNSQNFRPWGCKAFVHIQDKVETVKSLKPMRFRRI